MHESDHDESHYNPRWLLFCTATGRDPNTHGWETNAAFMAWIRRHVVAYEKAGGVVARDQDAFTRWLEAESGARRVA